MFTHSWNFLCTFYFPQCVEKKKEKKCEKKYSFKKYFLRKLYEILLLKKCIQSSFLNFKSFKTTLKNGYSGSPFRMKFFWIFAKELILKEAQFNFSISYFKRMHWLFCMQTYSFLALRKYFNVKSSLIMMAETNPFQLYRESYFKILNQ